VQIAKKGKPQGDFMPQNTATVVGPSRSQITVAISSGTIVNAAWCPPAPAGVPSPTFAGQIITVPNLPPGDSSVRVDLSWAPGDGDAEVRYPGSTPYAVVDYIFRHSQAGTVYVLLLFGT
jgi:hypothetical protein